MTETELSKMKLKKVFILSRHGQRSPLNILPLPDVPKSSWPFGASELTRRGKLDQYRFGKYIRNRYSHFLTDSPREVSAACYEDNRAFESCSLILAGLYPPKGVWKWHENLDWQPIAIRRASHSGLLKKESKLVDSFITNLVQESEQQDLLKDPMTCIRNYGQQPKLGFGNTLIDNLICSYHEGLSLPKWATENWQEIKRIDEEAFCRMYSLVFPKPSKTFFDLMIEQFKGETVDRDKIKICLCVQSDANVFSALQVISSNIRQKPEFGAALMLEVYEDESGHRYIEALYKPQKEEELEHVRIKGFAELCPLNAFLDLVESVYSENLDIDLQSVLKILSGGDE